ncbi:MAG: GxxExxY protein, partial [Phycisphaerales bacterium]|nr:GxxExxY protein [Phycisphaerales bacterium]
MASEKILFGDLTERVIGAAIEVHRTLGPGLLESIYERALAIELQHCGLRAARQVPCRVKYRGVDLG